MKVACQSNTGIPCMCLFTQLSGESRDVNETLWSETETSRPRLNAWARDKTAGRLASVLTCQTCHIGLRGRNAQCHLLLLCCRPDW